MEWEEMFGEEEEFISQEDMATILRVIRNMIEKAESKEQLLKEYDELIMQDSNADRIVSGSVNALLEGIKIIAEIETDHMKIADAIKRIQESMM